MKTKEELAKEYSDYNEHFLDTALRESSESEWSEIIKWETQRTFLFGFDAGYKIGRTEGIKIGHSSAEDIFED